MQLIATAASSGSGGKLAVPGSDVVARVQAITPQDSHARVAVAPNVQSSCSATPRTGLC